MITYSSVSQPSSPSRIYTKFCLFVCVRARAPCVCTNLRYSSDFYRI
jgi:hypothetical protein